MPKIWFLLKRRWNIFLINHIYAGTRSFERKRVLMNQIGHKIDTGTRIVGPIECTGTLICGKNCWIGKNFRINGNGIVTIEDSCDIGPEVTFQTGSHQIGGPERRAGTGYNCNQRVGSGSWIGGGVTILGNTDVGKSCVIASCACVTKSIPDNVLSGGVPAKILRMLDHDDNSHTEKQDG